MLRILIFLLYIISINSLIRFSYKSHLFSSRNSYRKKSYSLLCLINDSDMFLHFIDEIRKTILATNEKDLLAITFSERFGLIVEENISNLKQYQTMFMKCLTGNSTVNKEINKNKLIITKLHSLINTDKRNMKYTLYDISNMLMIISLNLFGFPRPFLLPMITMMEIMVQLITFNILKAKQNQRFIMRTFSLTDYIADTSKWIIYNELYNQNNEHVVNNNLIYYELHNIIYGITATILSLVIRDTIHMKYNYSKLKTLLQFKIMQKTGNNIYNLYLL